MDIDLGIAALLVLIAAEAYVIHRLNSAHSEGIALRSSSRFLPGPPAAGTTPPPPWHSTPSAALDRRDHRDGGRGRHRPRRHRERTTHNTRNAAGR
ncbi:hypothetical protein ABZ178_02350 [Streptomyces massasporeus]|uniref:hypothetical protein n=1 Tax=Streptomyces massasporeus TaxID=67324 RepID=UPI001673C1E9|nr:hypothetical protein [Streptomyces massasporeus]GGV81808.1 hypothetical protein GCM10010228_55540 [Streptomyces massasporeus]